VASSAVTGLVIDVRTPWYRSAVSGSTARTAGIQISLTSNALLRFCVKTPFLEDGWPARNAVPSPTPGCAAIFAQESPTLQRAAILDWPQQHAAGLFFFRNMIGAGVYHNRSFACPRVAHLVDSDLRPVLPADMFASKVVVTAQELKATCMRDFQFQRFGGLIAVRATESMGLRM